ncbi:MAG: hypothetical protein R2844_00930 [Caldilineales bacterium]
MATTADKELVGAGQIAALLSDDKLPFGHQLCVEVAVDSGYSKPEYLAANRHRNLITIVQGP